MQTNAPSHLFDQCPISISLSIHLSHFPRLAKPLKLNRISTPRIGGEGLAIYVILYYSTRIASGISNDGHRSDCFVVDLIP